MTIQLNTAYSFYALGRRKNQEDARFPDADSHPAQSGGFFIVCDGVGGEAKGEVASNAVAKSIGRRLEKFDPSDELTDNDIAECIGEAYRRLDRLTDNFNLGMATTLTLIVAHAAGVSAIHIGDSRIYQIRPGSGIIFKSEDHSLVNALVKSGNITPEQAENHPLSNVITRCLSNDPKHSRDKASVSLLTDIRPGDFFFLMSDGVLSMVDDDKLCQIAELDIPDENKRDLIRDLAADSSDNNTMWMVSVAGVDGMNTEDFDNIAEGDVRELSEGDEGFENPGRMTVENDCHDVAPIVPKSLFDRVSDFFKRK